jgi:hypothetical protein
MGDYSRDPITRLENSVARHYVGVRLQQGVPILDTDWNELEALRKYELQSLMRHFIGDGVPDDNDGFHIKALAGGGVGTVVLEAIPSSPGFSSLEIDFAGSTAASILGFLPGSSATQRFGSFPARLTGNAKEPFPLASGLTLIVVQNETTTETVTFAAADFANIGQATAAEVVAALSAALTNVTPQVGTGNDFIIRGGDGMVENAGRILVSGIEVLNDGDMTYTSQPLYENDDLAEDWGVPPVRSLVAPAGVGRTDLVYLDVWEREVGASEDDGIVLQAVGLETSRRLKREWAIRVEPDTSDLSTITLLPDHYYLVLARIDRPTNEIGISTETVIDLRVRNLNVSKYLKTPIFLTRGSAVLDAERFADMVLLLKSILLIRWQRHVFDFNYTNVFNRSLVQMAIQDIVQQSAFAAIQARVGNFNNNDGLQFMHTLYGIQKDFVMVVGEYGNVGGSAQSFIDDYTTRLDAIAGLKPALENGDLITAVSAQEAINSWLSLPVDVLPEGSVLVSIQSVQPEANLTLNVPFNIVYEIESRLSSPQALEAYNISFSTVLSSTWDISLNKTRIEVDAFGGRDMVTLTVTPRAGTVSTRFRLIATAVRNPLVTFTHESDNFQVGQPPPMTDFFQWVSPPLDSSGRIPIQQIDFSDAQFTFQLNLINRSNTVQRTFEVLHFVIPPEGDVTGAWHPLEAEATPSEITLDPGESQTDSYNLFGPSAPLPDVGTEGTLVARATLIDPDPAPNVVERILNLTFMVVA